MVEPSLAWELGILNSTTDILAVPIYTKWDTDLRARKWSKNLSYAWYRYIDLCTNSNPA